MQVSFKLTHEQSVRAQRAVKMASLAIVRNNEFPSNNELVECGNMVVQFDHKFSFNRNQYFNHSKGIMTIAGERCAIRQDSGMAVVAEVAGYKNQEEGNADGWSKLNIVSYHSSEPTVPWYETVRGFIEEKATFEQFASLVERDRISITADDLMSLTRFGDLTEAFRLMRMYGVDSPRIPASITDRRAIAVARKIFTRPHYWYERDSKAA